MTDDPHDDSAHWAGQLRSKSNDGTECTTKRTTRRAEQPDVQRKKPRLAKDEPTQPSVPD